MSELRTVLKENSDGVWVKIRMMNLDINNRIRMYEPDGTPVVVPVNNKNVDVFRVVSMPHLVDGVWAVDVDYT